MSGGRELVQAIKYLAYLIRGKRPFTTGYGVYKARWIAAALARGEFDSAKLPLGWGVGLDERVVEYPWLFSRLPSEPGRLLDAGSALNFGYVMSQSSLATKAIFISTLAPEPERQRARADVSYVYEDLRRSCFRDEYFDWVVSLSTLEHVGMDNTRFYTTDAPKREERPQDYCQVVGELRRILRPGGILYATLPFGRHENFGWLQVFDAAMVDTVLEVFAPVSYSERYFHYEPDGWRASSREESKDARYVDSHRRRPAANDTVAAGAVVCLELQK